MRVLHKLSHRKIYFEYLIKIFKNMEFNQNLLKKCIKFKITSFKILKNIYDIFLKHFQTFCTFYKQFKFFIVLTFQNYFKTVKNHVIQRQNNPD